MSGGGRKPAGDETEVDALLQVVQDNELLNLQAETHLVSSFSCVVLVFILSFFPPSRLLRRRMGSVRRRRTGCLPWCGLPAAGREPLSTAAGYRIWRRYGLPLRRRCGSSFRLRQGTRDDVGIATGAGQQGMCWVREIVQL